MSPLMVIVLAGCVAALALTALTLSLLVLTGRA